MSNEDLPRPKRSAKRNEPRTLARFIQELAWLLTSYEDLDFKALDAFTEEFLASQRANAHLRSHSAQRRQTTQLLVGVLPALLTDEQLFASNVDIIDFANGALGISIPRWQKKSKYELIGHIVCQTENADPVRLDGLVRAVGNLLDDRGETRIALRNERSRGSNWNEVIQKMLAVK